MNCRTSKILFAGLFCFLFCMAVPPVCRSVTLPVPKEFQERFGSIIMEYEKISQELEQIQACLNRDMDAVSEEEYKQDTVKLFKLMDDLAEKRKTIAKMREDLDDYFSEPPVLKLVRITGPSSGVQENSSNNLGYPIEIDHKPGSAGYTRRARDASGNLYSSAGVAVTYAPLEIRPGEPFHFEVEARQAAYLDQSQECSGSDPYRMGIQIDPDNSFSSPTVVMSGENLKCKAGSVKLSMNFKPKPPFSPEPGDYWKFNYDMAVVTSGTPVQGHPVKAENSEIAKFRLRSRKSSVSMSNRAWYKFDVSVRPVVFDGPYGNAPEIILHYRAQDESIAFLPEYQFPEDVIDSLVKVPDVKGLLKQEAIDKLTKSRLNPVILIGDQAERADLSGTVASQSPEPDQRVKMHSTIEVTLYSDNIPDKVELPDFSKKSVEEAKSWLNEKGIKIKLAASGPAPSDDLSLKVKDTEPAAGQKISTDSEVTVRVFGKYSPKKIPVPDLSGMSVNEAKEKLTESGFKIRLNASGAAPTRALSYKVKETEPKAGSEMVAGSEILIYVYGQSAQQLISIPEVAGLSVNEGKNRLKQKELNVSIVNLGPAPSPEYSNQIKDTVPRSGTKVVPGADIELRIYGKYKRSKAEWIAATDCSRWPGSKAYWSEEKGKTLCGCPGSQVWNLDKTRCVSRGVREGEQCARNYPGSVPTGRNASGTLACNCPNGYVWNRDRTGCIRKQQQQQRTQGGGNTNRKKSCDIIMGQIKMLVKMASNSSNDALIKSQIEFEAADARRKGCMEADIQQAMGKYGTSGNTGSGGSTGGDYSPCECPRGSEMVDERETSFFGQGDVYCVYPDGRKEICP